MAIKVIGGRFCEHSERVRIASYLVTIGPLLLLGFVACGGGGSTYVPGAAGMGGGSAGGGKGQGGSAGKSSGAGNTGDAGQGGDASAGGSGQGGKGGSGRGGAGGSAGSSGSGNAGSAGNGGNGGSGGVNDVFGSCKALHDAEPGLPSGPYSISPPDAAAPFGVYCDMETDGGGWTLAVNEGTSFQPLGVGVTDSVCYLTNCTNRAYSTLRIAMDLMFDMSDGSISGDAFTARAIVHGVQADTRGITLRTAFIEGPYFVEAEDNSNVVMLPAGACNTLPFLDADDMFCGPRTVTLGDATGPQCGIPAVFAIGGSESYSVAWDNCAGWPQLPNPAGNFFPDNVRVWVR